MLETKTSALKICFICLFLLLFMPGLVFSAFQAQEGIEVFANPGVCNGAKIQVHYWLPEKIASDTPILFVCHGVKRNPDKYLKEWKKYAAKLKVVLIAPGFSTEYFPKGKNYNRGSMFDHKKNLNPVEKWSYSAIEKIFAQVKNNLGLNCKNFIIYGHSAGAQFVHRMIIFLPQTSAGLAIVANAGSLTFLNSQERYPYGLKKTEINHSQMKKAFSRKLILMLGLEDTDPNNKYLNNSRLAKKQGQHRLERGRNFFAAASSVAQGLKFNFAWEKVEIPKVGHSNRGMAKAAFLVIQNHLGQVALK